jgi:hypothetical protein
MSVECMDRVFRYSKTSKPAERLVLLAIADHANADGTGAYPSLQTIAAKCGDISTRYVTEMIRNLEKNGELIIETGGGKKSNHYIVNVWPQEEKQAESMSSSSPVNSDTPMNYGSPVNYSSVTHEPGFTPPMNHSSTDPSFNHPKPSVREKPRPLNGTTSTKPIPQRGQVVSQRVEARKFVDGRIPVGTGTTPVEVYYERHSVRNDDTRLNAPLEDDIMAAVDDLAKWRQVVTAWQQSGYRAKNIAGQLEWYRQGIPTHKGQANGTSLLANGWAQAFENQDEPEYLKQMKQGKPR